VLDAAVAALSGDQAWVGERNRVYEGRRDRAMRGLREIGLEAEIPKASLYIWFKVPAGWTAQDFTLTVLEKAHVSLVPGTVFGSRGEGYARLSLTETVERLDEAMERMRDAVRELDAGLRRQR
jgi:LL-diaminopimelate aminotransferase